MSLLLSSIGRRDEKLSPGGQPGEVPAVAAETRFPGADGTGRSIRSRTSKANFPPEETMRPRNLRFPLRLQSRARRSG